jgi:PAS domain S-box-containing protein
MTVPATPARRDTAPALFRLLAESALSRDALGACATPIALLQANAKGQAFSFVNASFESFFGHRQNDLLGRSPAVLFAGDEALTQRLFSDPQRRWELSAWSKDGGVRHVEVTLGAVRSSEGKLTHWVLAFSDRGEVARLRAELEQLKAAASGSLGLCLEPALQPARGAQKAAVEIATADELNADRQSRRILHQR